jgi:hypothetical protein
MGVGSIDMIRIPPSVAEQAHDVAGLTAEEVATGARLQ